MIITLPTALKNALFVMDEHLIATQIIIVGVYPVTIVLGL